MYFRNSHFVENWGVACDCLIFLLDICPVFLSYLHFGGVHTIRTMPWPVAIALYDFQRRIFRV